MLDIFSEGTQMLPEGDVQTYVASMAPFKLTFRLKGQGKSSNQYDIVLDPPLLTSDGKHVTGRIDLTVSVIAQGSRVTSVIPESADRLLQLLGLSGDVVTKSDVAKMIKGELSPKLLALDLRGYTADELRNNQEPLREISNSLKTELASATDRFGLQLDDFHINWAPSPQEVLSTKQPERDSPLQDPQSRLGSRSSAPVKSTPKQTRTQDPKSRRGSRPSQTRRQSVSKRTTNKSAVGTSVVQQLEDSGLFDDGKLQESTGTVSYQVTGRKGATIYVTKSEREIHIFDRAFRNNNFPNNRKFYDFVRRHKHGMSRSEDDPNRAFKLKTEYIAEVIDLIRSGLYNDPNSRQRSRPSQTRPKRSVNKSTAHMTVLEKFIEAFPTLHEEKKSDTTISFKRGATVYFRKTLAGPNEARIHSRWVSNFPNASKLQSYLERNNVPIDTRPDYKIGPEHVDQVIAILKEDG